MPTRRQYGFVCAVMFTVAYFPMYSWSFTTSDTQGVSLNFIILGGYWWKESGRPGMRCEGIKGVRGLISQQKNGRLQTYSTSTHVDCFFLLAS